MPHAEVMRKAANDFPEKVKAFISMLCRCFSSPLSSLSSWHNADGTNPSSTTSHKVISSSSLSPRHTVHIAIHHTLGQLCTVLSLSTNSISFAHVVKAMEPFFSALASLLFLGQRMDIRVYLSLVPVVGGVIMACAGSKEFSWISFLSGMGSNVFFAMRGVLSKIAMEGRAQNSFHAQKDSGILLNDNSVDGWENDAVQNTIGKNPREEVKDHSLQPLNPVNLFAAVTCVSFFLSIPLVLIFEGRYLRDLILFYPWEDEGNGDATNATIIGKDANQTLSRTLTYIILSGLFHYLNNEVMYLVLSNVHPITLAVGNTLKRVFIIIAGILVFSTPTTWQTALGSTIGIGGVFVYSLMKQWYNSDRGIAKENDGANKFTAVANGANDEATMSGAVELVRRNSKREIQELNETHNLHIS